MFEREGAHFLLVRGGGKGLEREAVVDEESTPANIDSTTQTRQCAFPEKFESRQCCL